ncbi:MAG: hypothetical protein GY910_09610 [bacterium]|nr:hypothetical protein [Deltaproteobacteria bacterium]MCP4905226.1 hypothetical protein [bacterium]
MHVDLDGSSTIDYRAQTRQLSRFCVDICNEQGWGIPFTQLTLHRAPEESAASAEPIVADILAPGD